MSLLFNVFSCLICAIIGACFAGSSTCIANTCQINEDSLRFFLLGDWGGQPTSPYYTENQQNTARSLAQMCHDKRPHFILGLGDNFYTTGVKNSNDPRFQSTFEQVYTDPTLQLPWYFIAGNHDHYGNVQGEIDYSASSQRWNYPSLYYTIHYTFNGIKVDVVMIDTIDLCGNTKVDWFAKLFGKSDQPTGPKDKARSDQQWAWIQDQLKNSNADYLFVVGHFPIYSVAEHGSTICLVNQLLPIVKDYKATAYISGHDHSLQHLQVDSGDKTMNFVVSGTGSIVTYSRLHQHGVPQDSLKYLWPDSESTANTKDGAFVYMELNAQKAQFQFYRSTGALLYQFDVPKRQN